MAHELPSIAESDIVDSLSIHANVLDFASNDKNSSLQLAAGKLVSNTKSVNLKMLKGHNLSARTMKRCVPSILLQIYANPCMYWLHQPAFYVLLHRLNVPKDEISHEMSRIKRIFSHEFVTRKISTTEVGIFITFLFNCSALTKFSLSLQQMDEIVNFLNDINILQDAELCNLLLSSIIPFIFCYYNVIDVIMNQVIHLKSIFEAIQYKFYKKIIFQFAAITKTFHRKEFV